MSKIPKKRILDSYAKEESIARKKNKQEDKKLVFEIVSESAPKVYKKFRRTEKNLSFKVNQNFSEISNLIQIKHDITKNFENLINRLTENENPEHYITLEISNKVLEYPIYIGHQKIKDFQVSCIFERINKYIQSSKDLFNSGIIDLNVVIVDIIHGGGPKKSKAPTTIPDIGKKKRSIITIKNRDNLCAFRALFVAIYYKDNKLKLSQKEWQKVRKDHNYIQTKGAREIMKKCGLESCDSIGPEEWKIIQKYYPQYQIKVIDGAFKNNWIFRGEEKLQKVFIEYLENHYNAIISIQGYMTRDYYCETCHIVFKKLFDHCCESHCKNCYESCDKTPGKYTCSECNRDFEGSDCYERHLNNKICKYIKKCVKCKVIYKRKHKCHQYFCKKCNTNYDIQPHFCFIKPKNISDLQEEDNINKIIVSYDIESTQVGGEHVPNLLICETKCDKCPINNEEKCEVCFIHRPTYYFGKFCVKEFVKYLFVDLAKKAEENKSTIYAFAHNARGYDAQFVLREVWNCLFTNVEVIMRGRKILIIKCGNVKLLDSLNFFLQPLAKLPKALGLDASVKKGDFPHLFNRKENYSYIGRIPDLKYFTLEYMTKENKEKVEKWHKEFTESGKEWNFMNELVDYCKSDVSILMKCVMRFREVFKGITGLDPITRSFTLASIGLEVFKANFLKKDTNMAISPVEGYSATKNHSITADCWLDYIQKSKNIKLLREYRIGKYWVDGYDKENDVIYEFCGCKWHGHECLGGNLELKNKLKDKFEYLKDHKLIYIWECEYKKDRENDICMKQYFHERYNLHSKLKKYGNAKIRESFFGGRVNNLKFYHSVEEDEEIKYLDVCSLYPYVLKNRKFPIGHPEIIRENFDYSLKSYFGFVKCKIEPPRGLYLPVLPYMTKDKLLFPLCLNCFNTQNSNCICKDREIINTWTTEELKLAIEKGYIIREIYEILHYPDSCTNDTLFKAYVDMWLKIKQEASGWPTWCNNEENKQKYIKEYQDNEGIQLEYEKIEKNEALRFIAKIMLNSFWGKLAQRPNQSRTKIINSYDEYYELIVDQRKEITGELMVNEDTLIVTWEWLEAEFDTVKNYNIAVGSYVTAYARIKLYEIMEEIENIRPFSLLYHDTDSVMFVRKINDPKIKCGDYLGELTDEIEKNYGSGARGIKFVSLGPKNYGYIVDLGDNKFINEIKCKGISLTCNAKDIITFEKMVELAVKYSQDGITDELLVPQRQFTLNAHCQIFTRHFEKIYKAVSEKRVINGNLTLPFGY